MGQASPRASPGIGDGTACSIPPIGPYGRWFPGAMLNTCFNCLDRHVAAGRGEQAGADLGQPDDRAGRDLHLPRRCSDRTAKLAGALAALGVARGDRVVIYLPMVPEAAIAMLACARLGAIHSVVFGGFAAAELASRIADAKPKVIVSRLLRAGAGPGGAIQAAAGRGDRAVAAQAGCLPDPAARRRARRADRPAATMICAEAEAAAAPHDCRCRWRRPIRCTSSTPRARPGRPKGMVRDNGGHAVALWNSMRMLYGVDAGDVYWAASDVGWVVGHSYIVYAPLLRGCTSVMYEGKPVGTPDAGAFWRVCAQHGCKVLFTAPTAMRAIKQQDPDGKLLRTHDLSKLEALFLAGERCDPPTAVWAAELLGKPVVDHWWQTETGWAITGGFRQFGLFPFKPGSGGRPSPGYDLHALDDDGQPAARRARPAICALRLPLPPGCAPTLWQNDEGYRTAYLADFPGWYRTGDAGDDRRGRRRLGDGPHRRHHQRRRPSAVHRADGGGAGVARRDVAECAVVGAKDALKGQTPIGLVVLKAGREPPGSRDRRGTGGAGARADRPGGGVQGCARGAAAAEDAVGQDPARLDPPDRRWRGGAGAADHRGSRRAGGSAPGAGALARRCSGCRLRVPSPPRTASRSSRC